MLRDCTVYAAKTKALISCAVTFVFAYAQSRFSHEYTAIFHGLKNDNFQMKNCVIFLIFAQNIDCGYALEPPQ